MSVREKLVFHSQANANEQDVLESYAMWCKSKKVITNAFPEVFQCEYYQKLQLYGIQRFWMRTWVDRFQTARTIEESDPDVNNCWASLLLVCLDQIWPNLDKPSACDRELLVAINALTDKIKGSRMHTYGLAALCDSPLRVEGFIDLFEDKTSNDSLVQWVRGHFLRSRK